MKKAELDKEMIVHDYIISGMGAGAIAKKYKTSPKRVRAIIDEYGIEHKKSGSQIVNTNVVHASTVKYPLIKDKQWVVYDPLSDFTSIDINNKSGALTSYIEKQYGIVTPPNYDRVKYYTSTGNYWWEQWLKVRIEDVETNKETRLTRWSSLDKDLICDEYINTSLSVDAIAKKYQVGKKRLQDLFKERGLSRKEMRGETMTDRYKRGDYKKAKYQQPSDDTYLVVYDPNTDFMTTDLMNKGGHLTTYVEKQYGIETPPVYNRNIYYMETGNYWWEQWLKVKSVKKKDMKKCPYCGWVVVNTKQNCGLFKKHLEENHGMTIVEYLEEHPEDEEFLLYANPTRNNNLETDPKKFVVCPICGDKYRRLTHHMKTKHNIDRLNFAMRYGDIPVMCEEEIKAAREKIQKVNIEAKFTKHSSYEELICNMLTKNGIEFHSDRKVLDGKEIDILIPNMNIGFEINGCEWHSEESGKDKNYHIDKTIECRKKGVSLIHIFDDEINDHRDVVLSKIRHILHLDKNLPKINARNCVIKVITPKEATNFLNVNHIQGNTKATVYLGAYYKDSLVGVMSFLKEAPGEWNLTRFATDMNYICRGIGGKLFNYFTRNIAYTKIKSFLDRRWCADEENNIYTKLGFTFDGYTSPDYRYYHKYLTKGQRLHKFLFRKERLMLKYGEQLTFDMTEREMTEKLGLRRVWDCGLIRYVYTNPNLSTK